jgi:hypothetical protein
MDRRRQLPYSAAELCRGDYRSRALRRAGNHEPAGQASGNTLSAPPLRNRALRDTSRLTDGADVHDATQRSFAPLMSIRARPESPYWLEAGLTHQLCPLYTMEPRQPPVPEVRGEMCGFVTEDLEQTFF